MDSCVTADGARVKGDEAYPRTVDIDVDAAALHPRKEMSVQRGVEVGGRRLTSDWRSLPTQARTEAHMSATRHSIEAMEEVSRRIQKVSAHCPLKIK